jgi:cell fate (sporulation/competence/biofilm development) regulator YlbF (YheA/YmcA/DUF963 family)
MATTQEIVQAAQSLGKLIAGHPMSQRFEQVVSKLRQDTAAQRVLTDYNRMAEKIGQKETAGQAIEVDEKRQLEKVRNEMIRNSLLSELQMAQMDYLDLMRQVDDAINGGSPGRESAGPGAPGAPGSPGQVPLGPDAL